MFAVHPNKNLRLFLLLILIAAVVYSLMLTGCAQIGAPTGGPKDTLAPVLVKANPDNKTINFKGNRINISFNEYIELKDLSENLIISPLPKHNPIISSSLRTVSIKLKDTLSPNTTFSIDFGNAVADINEGNILKGFSYVFSTGLQIDSFQLKGKVWLAESGKTDSTLKVLLYRNAPDSAVQTKRPDYLTRLNGKGEFVFNNLPADEFRVYVLKDGDGNKFYNAKTETFGFLDQPVASAENPESISLYAYAEKEQDKIPAATSSKKSEEKKLRYVNNFINGKQDLLQPLELSFPSALKNWNKDSIWLCDTNYKPIDGSAITLDSTRKKISLSKTWVPDEQLHLILKPKCAEDSMGLSILKNDTIHFTVKSIAEYGSLKINFSNLDLSKHPLLQFMDGEQVKWKFPVTANTWQNKMMLPGEFEVRVLYDVNENGKWDPGDYAKKKQPERAITLQQKIAIKADWDNERDVEL